MHMEDKNFVSNFNERRIRPLWRWVGVNQKQKLGIHWTGTILSNKINAIPSYEPATLLTPEHQISIAGLMPLEFTPPDLLP